MVFDGILCGISGAYLTLSLTPSWSDHVVAGVGWVAFTLVIFSGWNPKYLVLGALVFGGTRATSYIIQIQGWGIHPSFLGMAPYLVTIILVAIPFLISRQEERMRIGIGPAARGTDFMREG
jgi:simple sugar transport system permease protein